MFGQLLVNLTQMVMPKDVAGPVGIVQMTHKIVELGAFMELIKFTALLSISLAVINILPFPALDGGRLLFIIYELRYSWTIASSLFPFLYCEILGTNIVISS